MPLKLRFNWLWGVPLIPARFSNLYKLEKSEEISYNTQFYSMSSAVISCVRQRQLLVKAVRVEALLSELLHRYDPHPPDILTLFRLRHLSLRCCPNLFDLDHVADAVALIERGPGTQFHGYGRFFSSRLLEEAIREASWDLFIAAMQLGVCGMLLPSQVLLDVEKAVRRALRFAPPPPPRLA